MHDNKAAPDRYAEVLGKNAGKAKDGQEAANPQDERIDLGRCASGVRYREVRCLTIRFRDRPWEALPYSHMVLNNTFEPQHRFCLEFGDYDYRKRLVVEGRNLEELFTLCMQGRIEWIAATATDDAKDGEFIVLKTDIVDARPKSSK